MRKKVKDTTIKLKKDDSALVITGDGEIHVFLPEFDPDEIASDGLLVIAILGILLNEGNNTLAKLIAKKAKELAKEEASEEE